MKLVHLTIENFLIIKYAEVPLDAKDLILVLGYSNDGGKADSNGAGKSALFNALCWNFYGKTYQGLSHDDVINNRTSGGTRVQVDLLIDDNELTIVRHRGHKKYKNKLLIFNRGVNVTPFTQQSAEALLRSFLPLSYTAFKHVVYFGQGMATNFLALNDTGRKQLLEELLGLDVFNAAEAIAKQKLKELNTRKVNLQGKQETLEEAISDVKAKLISLEAERDSKVAELQSRLDDLLEEDSFLRLEKKALTRLLEKTEKARTDVEKQLTEARQLLRLSNKSSRTLSNKLAEADANKRNILSRMKIVSKLSVCDKCAQTVPEEHKEKQIRILHDKCEQQLSVIDLLEEEQETLSGVIENQESLIECLDSILQELDEPNYVAELYRVSALIKKNVGFFKELQRSKAALLSPSTAFSEALKEHEVALREVESSLDKIAAEEPYLAYWQKGFSTTGIRSLLLDDVITYLNARINHHSRAISDGEIAISLSPQTRLKSGEVREKMSITASTGGAGYKAASGGQKRRMDLAVHFALSDLTSTVTGHRINLLICDEVLDCIDGTGTEAILAMLREKTKAGLTVFLIDHVGSIKDSVETVYLVTKEDGVSTGEMQ